MKIGGEQCFKCVKRRGWECLALKKPITNGKCWAFSDDKDFWKKFKEALFEYKKYA